MPRGFLCTLWALTLLLSSIPSRAADTPDPSLTPLKSLVGEWKGTDGDGKAYKITYAFSSGGTSLTETLTPPDSPPMTTMYYGDGEQLMLTHYCSLNNQPRMRTTWPKEGDKDKPLVFTFVDATNLKNPTDVHMHQLTIEVKDHDHFSQTWILSKAGKDVPKTFVFERVKRDAP